ncbi:MAG: ABC transporter ATP-binding protein/permease [Candidatus Niameybacter stercoravium]|nr:ABC transporter ATP-binding protein/permease [Candidatus Niameybacter stercoravium]
MQKKYGTKDIALLPLKVAPLWATLVGITVILNGVMATAQIYITAKFIDDALAIVQGNAVLNSIYPTIGLLVCVLSYFWITRAFTTLFNTKLETILREKFRVELTEKRAKLAYRHIENHDTWDLIARVKDMPELKVKDAYYQLLVLIALIIKILGVLIILVTKVWWVPFVILVFAVPLFRMAVKSGQANYNAYEEVTKYRRKYEYLGGVLTGRDTVEERALFGYGKHLAKEWHEEYEKARKHTLKVDIKWYIKMKVGSILTASISVLSAIVMVGPVLEGSMSLGIFMALVNSIFELVQDMSWQLTGCLEHLAKHKAYLNDLTKFIALEEDEDALDMPLSNNVDMETIEFKNVSFTYPGTKEKILDGLSCKLEKGMHYAVVGANGSGKTTLTKLLTGLYTEYEGEILINGKELRTYTQAELKGLYAVIYQDFAKYEISLEDNIAIGHMMKTKDELAIAIEEVIEQVDLKEAIDKLPQGIRTPLGKIKEGGQDLSGGQWQRLAMARTIIKDAPMYILDEPTAALDPISESKLYEEFGKMSHLKTTLFISHRLGSIQLADKILVINKGKVIEEGTHEVLMALSGSYSEMYESQRSWYK